MTDNLSHSLDSPPVSDSPAPAADAPSPPYLEGLNEPQRTTVLTTEGPLLVLAGAGTGKTSALTARLAHLIHSRRAYPNEILAVTFTNKAAREMRERVETMVGGASLPWLGTFHSVSSRMLRRHAALVGLQDNYVILDSDDQIRLLKQIALAEGIDEKRIPPRLLAALIDSWKNRALLPEDVPEKESDRADGRGRRIYKLYQARLKSMNCCDFGDLLLHMLEILKNHREVLEIYQQRFRYIMVDEYQDSNICQYLWLRLLAMERKNICCVGDDDQSIYGWRGAEVGNILRFESDFPGAQIIRLEQNYRSTGHILAAASGLIKRNVGRHGKRLWTVLDGGEKLRVTSVWDGADEARRINAAVEDLRGRGVSLEQTAILVRAQFQTREFEDCFLASKLPYRIVGGFRFYERAEIRDIVAYLRLVQTPEDDLAFARIINLPRRGLGAKALDQVQAHAQQRGLSMLQAAEDIVGHTGSPRTAQGDSQSDFQNIQSGFHDDLMSPAPKSNREPSREGNLPTRAQRSLSDFTKLIAQWRGQVRDLSLAALTQRVIIESGYEAMLRADQSIEAAGRLDNLTELVRAMEDFDDLASFLEHVSLVTERDSDQNEARLTLMTMHAAKGLEFDHVFLAGWEEGLFPSQRTLDGEGMRGLEEERRLAYVAITRARRQCSIFHAANRRVYGQWKSAIPSRFISELPKDHCTHIAELNRSQSNGNWVNRDDWQRPRSSDADRQHSPTSDSYGQREEKRGSMHTRPYRRRFTESPQVPTQATPRSRPRPSPRARPRAEPTHSFAVGMRVVHKKFAGGVVQEVSDNKLQVAFDSGEERRILASYLQAE